MGIKTKSLDEIIHDFRSKYRVQKLIFQEALEEFKETGQVLDKFSEDMNKNLGEIKNIWKDFENLAQTDK